MPVINVTKSDIAKLQNMPAGWYSAEVTAVHPLKNAKSGESINQAIDFTLEHESGKIISATFNTLLIGKIAPLWEAAFQQKFEPGSINTDDLLHKKVDVRVGQRTYEGQLIDEIQLFAPYGKGKLLGVGPF